MMKAKLEIPTRDEMVEREYPEEAIGFILSLEMLVAEYKQNHDLAAENNIELSEQLRKLKDDLLVAGIEKEAAERKMHSALDKSAQNLRRNNWYQRRYGEQPDRQTVNMNFLQRWIAKIFRI